MEAQIQLELHGRKPSKISDLLLEGFKVEKISGLTEEFSNLTSLSLIGLGLTTLDGLPKLHSLSSIELSGNNLSGGLNVLVDNCPKLSYINLSRNDIKNVQALEALSNLRYLACLDLFDCEVIEEPDNRRKIFDLLPKLAFLNGAAIDDADFLAEMSKSGKF